MGRYSHLSDDDLQAEIAQYAAAVKAVVIGGGVGRIGGEGRMMEITRPDIGRAETELRLLRAELARRPGFENRGSGGAIGVEIG